MNNTIAVLITLAVCACLYVVDGLVTMTDNYEVHVSHTTKVLKDTRYCEQMLDGAYVYDNVRRQAFCRTSTGFVAL